MMMGYRMEEKKSSPKFKAASVVYSSIREPLESLTEELLSSRKWPGQARSWTFPLLSPSQSHWWHRSGNSPREGIRTPASKGHSCCTRTDCPTLLDLWPHNRALARSSNQKEVLLEIPQACRWAQTSAPKTVWATELQTYSGKEDILGMMSRTPI